jgi:hypothetical protein
MAEIWKECLAHLAEVVCLIRELQWVLPVARAVELVRKVEKVRQPRLARQTQLQADMSTQHSSRSKVRNYEAL